MNQDFNHTTDKWDEDSQLDQLLQQAQGQFSTVLGY